ncbi:MAG: cytochrome c oxidase subunit II [Myxococcales bacterium]|nr:cytochrome c oxidase subunit II [Myxococcales bacterium]
MTLFVTTVLANAGTSGAMPPQASTIAPEVDGLFYFIFILCTIFFVGIVGAIIYFAAKYRQRSSNDRTSAIDGNHRLELLWSAIPTVLLLVIFGWSFRIWLDMSVPPGDAIDVRVTGQKWSWSYDYPASGCVGVSEIVVPVGEPVKLTMSSLDVLHSYFVPAFRIKRDVIPNRYTVQWFTATEVGTYPVSCTEYCGTGHSIMASQVRVVSRPEYEDWLANDCGGGDKSGEELFRDKGCLACHSVTGSKLVGPTMLGLYGREETLVGGEKVLVDDNYIRESIINPNAKVVQGYDPVMPTFKGRIKDRQIDAIIDYLKTLK